MATRQPRQFARQGTPEFPNRAASLAYVGAPGEPFFDLETLRMHDGVTPGGFRMAVSDINNDIRLPAYQIAPSGLLVPTVRSIGERLATNLAVAGKDFGMPSSPTADASGPINATMKAVGERGGGIVDVPVPLFSIARPLANKYPHVLLRGHGATAAFYGGENKGSVVQPTDNYSDPGDLDIPANGRGMLAHYNASTDPLLVGGGFENLFVNPVSPGGTRAARMLFARSSWRAVYVISGKGDVTSTEAVLFYAEDRAGNLGGSLQLCRVVLAIGQSGTADCIRFDGAPNSNVSVIEGLIIDVGHHLGHGLVLGNCDNVDIALLRASGSGAGGRCLVAKKFPGDGNRTARANKVRKLSANTAAIIEGTGDPVTSAKITYMYLDTENGTPYPEIQAGATCYVEGTFPYTPTAYSSQGAFASVAANVGRFSRHGAEVTGRVRFIGSPPSGTATVNDFYMMSLPRPINAQTIHGAVWGFESNSGTDVTGIVTNGIDPNGRAHFLFPGKKLPTGAFDFDLWFEYEAY